MRLTKRLIWLFLWPLLCSALIIESELLNQPPGFAKSVTPPLLTKGIPLVATGANRSVVVWFDVENNLVVATRKHKINSKDDKRIIGEWKLQRIASAIKLNPVAVQQVDGRWIVLFQNSGVSVMASVNLDKWPDRVRLFAAKSGKAGSSDLFPVLAVNTAIPALIVIFESTDPVVGGKIVDKDRDIFSVTGLIRGGLQEEASWFQPVGVNSDVQRDTSLERHPWIAASRNEDKLMATWRAASHVYVAFSTGYACEWENRKAITRVEEFKARSKSQKSVVVTNNVGTWVVIWMHKDYAIRTRRFVERKGQPWLSKTAGDWDNIVHVAPVAFPYPQLNFVATLVNDLSNSSRWAVAWSRIDPSNVTVSQIVVSISVDDAVSWTRRPLIVSQDGDYAISPALSCDANGLCVLAYGSPTGEVKSLTMASSALFDETNWPRAAAVPLPVDISDTPCSTIYLADQSATRWFQPSRGYQDDILQCWHIVNENTEKRVVLEMELPVDIEPADMCPYDFVSVSRLSDFGLKDYPALKEWRLCRRGRYTFTSAPGKDLWVLIYTDWHNTWENFAAKMFSALVYLNGSKPLDLSNHTYHENTPSQPSWNATLTRYITTYKEALMALKEHQASEKRLILQFIVRELIINEEPALVVRSGMNVEFRGLDGDGTRIVANTTKYPCNTSGGRRPDRLFDIREGGLASFRGLYVRNGFVQNHVNEGSALLNKGNLTLIHNCTFQCNGVGPDGARKPLIHVRGGAVCNYGHIDLISSTTFADNGILSAGGGAIDIRARASITRIDNCIFLQNTQQDVIVQGGGAIQVNGHLGTVINSVFEKNHAFGTGGAIFSGKRARLDRIIGCIFKQNTVEHDAGGAISINSFPLQLLRDSIFIENSVNGKGGAIYINFLQDADRAPVLTNLTFVGNLAENCAGAVCIEKGYSTPEHEITIQDSLFEHNKVLWNGEEWDDDALPTDVRLWSKEFNEPHAGAVAVQQSLITLNRCRFLHNAGIRGGAVGFGEAVVGAVISSEFANNTAFAQGGALYTAAKASGSNLEVLFCTFVSNKALSNCKHRVVYAPVRANNSRLQCDSSWVTPTIDPYRFDCRQKLAILEESLGCSHGVGGALSVHGNVEANLHGSMFTLSDVPNVGKGTYVAANGVDTLHLSETGQDIFTDVRIRATNCSFSEPIIARVLPISRKNTIATCTSSPFFACRDANSKCEATGPFKLTFLCSCTGAYTSSSLEEKGLKGGYIPRGCKEDQISSVNLDRRILASNNSSRTLVGVQASISFDGAHFTKREGFQRFEIEVVTLEDNGVRRVESLKLDQTLLEYTPTVGAIHEFRAFAVFELNGFETKTARGGVGVLLVCADGHRVRRLLITKSDEKEFECTPCPSGTYLVYGASMLEDACVKCPERLPLTRQEGSTHVEDCLPPPFTFYGDDGITRPCPEGATCGSRYGSHITKMGLRRGWWRPTVSSSELIPCQEEDLCIGTNDSNVLNAGAFGNNAWENTAYCRRAHTGPMCMTCVENFSLEGRFCQSCDNERTARHTVNLVVSIVVPLLIYLLVLVYLGFVAKIQSNRHEADTATNDVNRESKRSANGCSQLLSRVNLYKSKATILIGFFQVLATTLQLLHGKVPQITTQAVPSWMFALANMNLGYFILPGISCVIADNHHNQLYMAFGIFLVIVGAPAILHRLAMSFAGTDFQLRLKYYYVRLVFFLVFFTYPSTCSLIFSTFSCDQFGGSSALRSDYSIDCTSDEHETAVNFAIAMIVGYALGLPTVLALLLYLRRRAILSTNIAADETTKRLAREMSIVTGRYTRKVFWYEVVDIIRKLFQSGFIVLIASGSGLQLAVAICFCAVAAVVVTQADPFAAAGDKPLELLVQAQLAGVLLVMTSSYDKAVSVDSDLDFAMEVQAMVWIVWASPILTTVFIVADQFQLLPSFLVRSTYAERQVEDGKELEKRYPKPKLEHVQPKLERSILLS